MPRIATAPGRPARRERRAIEVAVRRDLRGGASACRRALAVSVALAVAAIGAAATPAGADDPSTVAVIPLQADRRLALYGAPVANALAGALRTATFDVVLVSDTSVVPTRAWLVVDGRLVRSGAAVAIELRIRDPERAIDVARLAAKAPSLAEIDGVTRTLAAELVALLERERTARAAAPAPPPVLAPGQPRPPTAPLAPRPIDRRPLARVVVIGRPIHDRTDATHDVVELGRPAAIALAHRLGYRAIGDGDVAVTITIELRSLAAGFERDIPIGRARARVKVEAASGVIFDRVVRTDTVVGSRGDRVDTLVRLVAAQVTDVVAPRIREILGSPAP